MRGYRACDPCKISKIRCDSQLPCANCTKKSRVACCKYSTTSSTTLSTKRGTRSRAQRHAATNQPESELPSPAVTTTASGGRRNSVVGPNASPKQLDYNLLASLDPAPSETPSQGDTSLSGAATPMSTGVTAGEQDSPQEHFVTGPNGETRKYQVA